MIKTSSCLIALLILTINSPAFCEEASLERMKRLCQQAREAKIAPLREAEIEECRWMPVQEYLNSEYVGAFNKRIVQAALQSKGVVPASIEGYTDPQKHEVFMPPELKGE